MTREQEIKEMAKVKASHITSDKDMQVAFADLLRWGAEWADAHPRWISVEDELPKEYEEVLAVANIDGNIVPFVGVCENGIFYYTEPTISKERKVTHWMPLPQPPKEGGQTL